MSLLPLLKALADPTRLRLVALLDRSECTVQELTDVLQMGQSRISRHLKILVEAGVLGVQRQGTWGYYRALWKEPLAGALRQVLLPALAAQPESRQDLQRLSGVMERRRQRSQAFFDRHARQWDALVAELLPTPDYQPALKALLPTCRELLDIGAGTGRLLAELAAPGRRITAIDQSPAMLAEARERAGAANLPGEIELRIGEMGHLPVAEQSTDCALLHLVLHHAPNPGAVFAELARVLRPQGQLVIVDLLRHGAEWVREQLGDQWLGFTRDELSGWLAEAGFAIQTYQELAGGEGHFGVFLLLAKHH